MEVDQDPNKAISLTSSPSQSPTRKPSSSAVVRTYTSTPRGSILSGSLPVEFPLLLNLPGLVFFRRSPMNQVDFVATTNEQSDSLWGINVDPELVGSEMGNSTSPLPMISSC